MPKPTKQEIMERYDELGQKLYDLRYTEEQQEKYTAFLDELVDCSLLLDNGCGTGLLFPYIESTLVGLDLSSGLLTKARERVKDNHYLVQGDSEYIPFRDSVFDALVSVTVIQNLSQPERLGSESARVSKPGSTVIISSLKRVYSRDEIRMLVENDELDIEKIFSQENINDWITVSTRKIII
jgi:ubiquinone/menaquinone biosynthesis C-methylase UbiE